MKRCSKHSWRIMSLSMMMLGLFVLSCSVSPAVMAQENTETSDAERRPHRLDNPETQKIALEIIKDLDPEAYQRLEGLKSSDPTRYQRHLRLALPMLRRLINFKKRDNELYAHGLKVARAKIEIRKTLAQLKKARQSKNEAEIETLTTALRKLITDKFDAELGIRERQLRILQSQIEKAQHNVDQLKEERATQIENELEQHLKKKRQRPQPPSVSAQ